MAILGLAQMALSPILRTIGRALFPLPAANATATPAGDSRNPPASAAQYQFTFVALSAATVVAGIVYTLFHVWEPPSEPVDKPGSVGLDQIRRTRAADKREPGQAEERGAPELPPTGRCSPSVAPRSAPLGRGQGGRVAGGPLTLLRRVPRPPGASPHPSSQASLIVPCALDPQLLSSLDIEEDGRDKRNLPSMRSPIRMRPVVHIPPAPRFHVPAKQAMADPRQAA